MDKRTVMKLALDWKNPPYVPWNINFTIPAAEKVTSPLSRPGSGRGGSKPYGQCWL